MIPTAVHGVLDYLVGLLLIVIGVANFGVQTTPGLVLVICGAAALVYSALTAYELGLVPVIPMTAHLGLDLASGLLLAASPWLLGFADATWGWHVVLGLMEVGVVALSARTPMRMPRSSVART